MKESVFQIMFYLILISACLFGGLLGVMAEDNINYYRFTGEHYIYASNFTDNDLENGLSDFEIFPNKNLERPILEFCYEMAEYKDNYNIFYPVEYYYCAKSDNFEIGISNNSKFNIDVYNEWGEKVFSYRGIK